MATIEPPVPADAGHRKRPNNLEPGNLIPGVGSAPKPHKALQALRGKFHLPL
jgi:hypothetical protein